MFRPGAVTGSWGVLLLSGVWWRGISFNAVGVVVQDVLLCSGSVDLWVVGSDLPPLPTCLSISVQLRFTEALSAVMPQEYPHLLTRA